MPCGGFRFFVLAADQVDAFDPRTLVNLRSKVPPLNGSVNVPFALNGTENPLIQLSESETRRVSVGGEVRAQALGWQKIYCKIGCGSIAL